MAKIQIKVENQSLLECIFIAVEHFFKNCSYLPLLFFLESLNAKIKQLYA